MVGAVSPKAEAPAPTLAALVAALPEIYQPIFGHPELSQKISRDCEDRLDQITRIYDLLSAELGRPLRVLDLGCAQGFFSLHLAARGAVVFGADFLPQNIAVCKALAAENPDFKIGFSCGKIEELIAKMPSDKCDLVLGLSVFHHIVHASGIGLTQKMLAILGEKATVGIFEMALSSEPPSWSQSQPRNPRELLAGWGLVHEFARNPTHLSDISRPLYIASNHYWLFTDSIQKFDRWTAEPHAFANNCNRGTRRYYFAPGKMAKVAALDSPERHEINLQDHNREIACLQNPPPGFGAPQLLEHGCNACETWLVRELVPGELLVDLMNKGAPYDADAVLRDILHQLAQLEAAGLYHDDVRMWNVLVAADGKAQLIDYGAISDKAEDCAWPHDLFLSFVIFMHEVLGGKAAMPNPLRQPLLNPETLPEPYRSAVWEVLAAPERESYFACLLDHIIRGVGPALPVHHGFGVIYSALECYGHNKGINSLIQRGKTGKNETAARSARRKARVQPTSCVVCGDPSIAPLTTKFGVHYFACKECEAVFSEDLDPNQIVTHNNAPEARANVKTQSLRLQRIVGQLGRTPQEILDFGCGRGEFVDFLGAQGINAIGVDQETKLKLSDVPRQSVDAVNMVEVIEHLGEPTDILRQLKDILKPGGIIYVESSFVDFIGDAAQSSYVDPRIGHCCIHSLRSIDFLSSKLSLRAVWINNNIVVLHKDSLTDARI